VNAESKLYALGAEADGLVIAQHIASALLESDRQPYCFSINHDIRPPKNEACLVPYDWALKGRVGMVTQDVVAARAWIIAAACAGYSIAMAHPKSHTVDGLSYSIKTVRTRIEFKLRHKDNDDDDIPF
jgi:hypothetical protein